MNLTESSSPDLDAEIARVEQRLIARELRLRAGATQLSTQVRRQCRPRRLLVQAASAVLGSAAVLALLRGRRHAGAEPTSAPGRGFAPESAPAGAAAAFAWAPWVGLAWPLLPARWRRRVSPSMATSVLTLGVPLLLRLLGRRSRQARSRG